MFNVLVCRCIRVFFCRAYSECVAVSPCCEFIRPLLVMNILLLLSMMMMMMLLGLPLLNSVVSVRRVRPLSRIFQKIRLAEPYFRLISGLAEFLRKLRNSAENTPEQHKFGQQDRQIQTIKFKIYKQHNKRV